MKKILNLTLLLMAMITVASCSSDKNEADYPTLPSDSYYDIATLSATTDNSSTFIVQKDANSPEVTYFSTVSFAGNKEFPVGCRLLIIYKTLNGAAPYSTCSISLYGFAQLNQTEPDVITGTAKQYNNWESDPIKLTSMWRTGNYLNVSADMFATTVARPTKFVLVADETTLDKPTIETYIIVKSNTSDGGNRSAIYASYDIKTLLEIETCQTIRVNYFDVGGFTYKDIETDHVTVRPLD